jgi:hypothetical protein
VQSKSFFFYSINYKVQFLKYICLHIVPVSVQVLACAKVVTVGFMLTTEMTACARVVTVRFKLTTDMTACARIVRSDLS